MQAEHGAMQDKDKSCNCLALGNDSKDVLIFKKEKRLKKKKQQPGQERLSKHKLQKYSPFRTSDSPMRIMNADVPKARFVSNTSPVL